MSTQNPDRKIWAIGDEAQAKLSEGVRKGADAVASTLGPAGRNAIIERKFRTPIVVDDGYTAINSCILEDELENLGISSLVDAANKASEHAGDGPQPLDSKILTPDGFVNMGDIKISDYICGTNGTIQQVIGIFPKGKKQIFKVVFSDKREVECCEDHLWSVITCWGSKKVLTTRQLIDSGLTLKKGDDKQYKYYTPVSIAEFSKKEFVLDPYLVGVLIGDGSLSGADSTEISLGFNKEHIIEKLILPKGLNLSVNYDELKNYFRVKIIGKTTENKTIRDFLKEIGLFGTHSKDKFIPKQYLYSDLDSRLALLQGLSDTDGYINNRGLLEYSTVSSRLHSDVLELLRGIGKIANSYLMERKDNSSYSNTPIYRIYESDGYKYGNKIIDIKPTDEIVEMQCIKVSNPDNLYFTDDYILTHNTSTTIVLTRAIYEAGKKLTGLMGFGKTPYEIKSELQKAEKEVIEALNRQSKPIKTKEEIKNVAIAAYNDEPMAEIVADMVEKVGDNGIILVEEGWGRETETEFQIGFKFAGKLPDRLFSNTPEEGLNLEGLPIVVSDFSFANLNDLIPLFKDLSQTGEQGVIIIAHEYSKLAMEQVIRTNIFNAQNRNPFRIWLVRTPSFTSRKYEDFAIFSGARYFSKEKGDNILEIRTTELGRAEVFKVSKAGVGEGIMTGGAGKKNDVDKRLIELKMLLADEKVKLIKNSLQQDIAALASAIGIIKVASPSDGETEHIRLKTKNAVKSCQAAVAEGAVKGAGLALKEISDELEEGNILKEALKAPYEVIQRNAGGKLVIPKDLYDATKVVRTAVEQACSQALMLINTSVIIAFRSERSNYDGNELIANTLKNKNGKNSLE